MRSSPLYINGKFINSKKTYIRENPATLDPLQEVSLASKKDVKLYTGINMTEISKLPKADILIYAVPHSFYSEIGSVEFLKFVKNDGLIIDVKSNLDRKIIAKSKKRVWRL